MKSPCGLFVTAEAFGWLYDVVVQQKIYDIDVEVA